MRYERKKNHHIGGKRECLEDITQTYLSLTT